MQALSCGSPSAVATPVAAPRGSTALPEVVLEFHLITDHQVESACLILKSIWNCLKLFLDLVDYALVLAGNSLETAYDVFL